MIIKFKMLAILFLNVRICVQLELFFAIFVFCLYYACFFTFCCRVSISTNEDEYIMLRNSSANMTFFNVTLISDNQQCCLVVIRTYVFRSDEVMI